MTDRNKIQPKEKRHRNKGFVDIPLHQLNEWFGGDALLQIRRKQLEELGFFVDNDSIPMVKIPDVIVDPVSDEERKAKEQEEKAAEIEWKSF